MCSSEAAVALGVLGADVGLDAGAWHTGGTEVLHSLSGLVASQQQGVGTYYKSNETMLE